MHILLVIQVQQTTDDFKSLFHLTECAVLIVTMVHCTVAIPTHLDGREGGREGGKEGGRDGGDRREGGEGLTIKERVKKQERRGI